MKGIIKLTVEENQLKSCDIDLEVVNVEELTGVLHALGLLAKKPSSSQGDKNEMSKSKLYRPLTCKCHKCKSKDFCNFNIFKEDAKLEEGIVQHEVSL